MTDTMWAFVALGGLVLVAAANLLRFRRTGDRGCLGHFFVSARGLDTVEWVLHRAGIAGFFAGIVLTIVL